ncbi:MAG: hypothetical protein ACLPY5_05680 [Candidatus Bathyarchaeia archaeon]
MVASGFRLRSVLAITLILSLAIVSCASNAYASTNRGGIGEDSTCSGGGGGNGNGGHGGGGNTTPHPGNQPIPGPIPVPGRITHLNQLGINTSGC